MALYHFTVKSDKKPDGTRIPAFEKVEYIEREGKYKDLDEKRMLEHNKFQYSISAEKLIESKIDQDMMLYESPFGLIMQAQDGSIKISKNASVETIAIALGVSQKIYGSPLRLSGSRTFKAQVLVAANEMDLPLHFADKNIEVQYQSMQEERKNGRDIEREQKRFADRSTKNRRKTGILKSDFKRRRRKISTRKGFSLPTLSERHMVFPGQRPAVLLRDHEYDSILRKGKEFCSTVRWDTGRARRINVKRTADQIMINIQNQLDNVFAKSHVQYINREAAFQQRGGCIYKAHHLPKWANENPQYFFQKADELERSGGERYKEIEFALPNELSLDQQKEIINKFLENHLSNYYYAYAVHDKIGVMSDGDHNNHVHIMFSTRELDDIENKQERPPELFFHRAFPKDPAKGGCKKADCWRDKNRRLHLAELREDFAKIQNEVLAKYGVPSRVDHRSLKTQRQEALANWHIVLAKILNRLPEKHIGPDSNIMPNHKKIIDLKKYRNYKAEYAKQLYAADRLEKSITEELIKKSLKSTKEKINTLSKITEIKKGQEKTLNEIRNLKDAFHKIQMEVNILKAATVWQHEAVEQAWLLHMTLEEKEHWQTLKRYGAEESHWKEFINNLPPLDSYNAEEKIAYKEMRLELTRLLNDLRKTIQVEAHYMNSVFSRLNEKTEKRKILSQIENILFENEPTKKKLEKKSDDLEATINELKHVIEIYQNDPRAKDNETGYTSKEVYDALLKEESELRTLLAEKTKGQKKLRVYSLNQALSMAKDVYTKGAFKKLRSDTADWKKANKYLLEDLENLEYVKKEFAKHPKPGMLSSTKVKSEWNSRLDEIKKSEASLTTKKQEMDTEKARIDKEENRLNNLCSSSAGKAKIQEIAAGILRKNQPNKEKSENLQNEIQDINKRLTHIKDQIQAAKKQANKDKGQISYKVVQKNHISPAKSSEPKSPESPLHKENVSSTRNPSDHYPKSAPSIIADALLGEPLAVQTVAYQPRDDKKEWNMLTELEKDEILNSIENLDRY